MWFIHWYWLIDWLIDWVIDVQPVQLRVPSAGRVRPVPAAAAGAAAAAEAAAVSSGSPEPTRSSMWSDTEQTNSWKGFYISLLLNPFVIEIF